MAEGNKYFHNYLNAFEKLSVKQGLVLIERELPDT